MKKIATLYIVSMLLLMTSVSFSTALNENKIIYVDDDGTADYTSIQDAVDVASDGDTIFVYSGIYHEHITFESKSITLQGENKDTTIIDADAEDSALWIGKGYDISISGFTFRNSGKDWIEAGIVLWECTNCIISNNVFTNCGWGLNIGISEEISIQFNEIVDNMIGVQFTGTKNSELKRNNVIDNSQIGLRLNDARFDYITENNFINNEQHLSFYGVYFNDIDANYWDQKIDMRLRPFIGKLFLLIPIPGLLFDWNPASKPYDIGGK